MTTAPQFFNIKRTAGSGSRLVSSYSDVAKPLTFATEADAEEAAENFTYKATLAGSGATYEVVPDPTVYA